MTCSHPFGHTDPAKRMSDAAMQTWTDNGWDSTGKFMAFRLDNGSTDGNLYPTKADAVRHNDEFKHCFIQLHPGGIGICEAEIMLMFYRKAYDAGFRLADPQEKSGGRNPIPRIGEREVLTQISQLGKRR